MCLSAQSSQWFTVIFFGNASNMIAWEGNSSQCRFWFFNSLCNTRYFRLGDFLSLDHPFFWKGKRKVLLMELCSVCVCVCVCVSVHTCMHAVAQRCLILCNLMDYSPQGSSVHGITPARILEWVAISDSRGLSQSREWTHVSCIADGFFTTESSRKSSWGCKLPQLTNCYTPTIQAGSGLLALNHLKNKQA